MEVFISHCGVDYPFMNKVSEQLTMLGHQSYLFEHDSQPGRLVNEKVTEAIVRCPVFLVFLTKNSADSTYVQQEIGFAIAHKKAIIPLVTPDFPHEALSMLQGREYIIFDADHLDDVLAKIASYAYRLGQISGQQQQQIADLTQFVIALVALAAAAYGLYWISHHGSIS